MSVETGEDYSRVEHQQQKTSVCNYINLLGGLTDLKKLSGRLGFSNQYLSIGIESCHSYLVFHHLNCIDLQYVNFREAKEISLVARLLIGAPNLHTLDITTDSYVYGGQYLDLEAPHLSFMDFEFAQDIRLEKLRVITIHDYTGLPLEIEFLKFLLESSPVLETMKAYIRDRFGSKENKRLRDELLGCSCASQTVKVSLF